MKDLNNEAEYPIVHPHSAISQTTLRKCAWSIVKCYDELTLLKVNPSKYFWDFRDSIESDARVLHWFTELFLGSQAAMKHDNKGQQLLCTVTSYVGAFYISC